MGKPSKVVKTTQKPTKQISDFFFRKPAISKTENKVETLQSSSEIPVDLTSNETGTCSRVTGSQKATEICGKRKASVEPQVPENEASFNSVHKESAAINQNKPTATTTSTKTTKPFQSPLVECQTAEKNTEEPITLPLTSASPSPPTSISASPPVLIPTMDPARHQRFLSKLGGPRSKPMLPDPCQPGTAGGGTSVGGPFPSKANHQIDDENLEELEKLKDNTPLEIQVIKLKKEYPGILLVIEVGYKFQFFGKDAEVAAKILHIMCFHNRKFRGASFPVHRLGINVRRLVQAGCKVGVVRQMETAAVKANSSNKSGPFERELTALYTQSTLEAGADLEGANKHTGEGGILSEQLARYLLCIVEGEGGKKHGGGGGCKEGEVEVGVVAVEPSTCRVLHAQFKDGPMRTTLERHYLCTSPSEVLVSDGLSSTTRKLLKHLGSSTNSTSSSSSSSLSQDGSVRMELVPADKFSSSKEALQSLKAFYNENDGSEEENTIAGEDGGTAVGASLDSLPPLVLRALAVAVHHLKQFKLQRALQFETDFLPLEALGEMSLSPNALQQLEVLTSQNGGAKGSLFSLLHRTKTAFGARRMHHWASHPLTNLHQIQERQDAVEEWREVKMHGSGDMEDRSQSPLACLESQLRSLPDLERMLGRVLHCTATPQETVHCLTTLDKLNKTIREVLERTGKGAIKSELLHSLLHQTADNRVSKAVETILSPLNPLAATQRDKLNLFKCRSTFPEVFKWKDAVKQHEKDLQDLLPSLRSKLKKPTLEYFSVAGIDFLLDLPSDMKVPANWIKVNSTKKTNRYHPPEVLEVMRHLAEAKERQVATSDTEWIGHLSRLQPHYCSVRGAVNAVGTLDCLGALADLACTEGYSRPTMLPPPAQGQRQDDWVLEIEGGRHPVLEGLVPPGSCYVENGVKLAGAEGPRAVVVTGPNMGGKSSYIRQVALITILAQVGSFVPARSARLSVVDAILTRMGAFDSLQRGTSTFMQEMEETSAILKTATHNSLVIIDELGRGTSTHDGVAIAQASLEHLLLEIGCRTLFVTHYPRIAKLSTRWPSLLQCGHMAFIQDKSGMKAEGEQGEPAKEGPGLADEEMIAASKVEDDSRRITFLYKLVPGIAEKSFGLNVARMADIPKSVIDLASVKAVELEDVMRKRQRHRVSSDSCEFSAEEDGVLIQELGSTIKIIRRMEEENIS